MRWVRLTLELLRPVPFAPLTVRAELTRPGKRVGLASASLSADGVELCRAVALRIRTADEPVTEDVAPERPFGPPGEGREARFPVDGANFATTGTEFRWVTGDWSAGPSELWLRLAVPVVPGEEPTPFQRAVALADYANGVAAPLPWEGNLFINPDLNVFLEREPEGEWIGMRAQSYARPEGSGLAESVLFDRRGRVGRGVQSLYVDRR